MKLARSFKSGFCHVHRTRFETLGYPQPSLRDWAITTAQTHYYRFYRFGVGWK